MGRRHNLALPALFVGETAQLSAFAPKSDDTSNTSRLDGELLQVLVIGDIGRDGVTDDIGRLLAIRLLPLSIQLLVGLGDFLLRRLLADKQE